LAVCPAKCIARLIALEGEEAGLSTWNSGIKIAGTDQHVQTPHQDNHTSTISDIISISTFLHPTICPTWFIVEKNGKAIKCSLVDSSP
jgi:hypothetical protein